MTPSPRRKPLAAQALLVLGLAATFGLGLPGDLRPGPDWLREAIVLLGPALFASGATLLTLDLAARRRLGRAKATADDTTPRRDLWAGLTMLLIGGFPWAYTPLLFGPDNEEAWGMFGTVIFLFVGLPGWAVTGIGVSRMRGQRRRRARGERRP